MKTIMGIPNFWVWLKLGIKIWINDHLFRIAGDYGPKKRK